MIPDYLTFIRFQDKRNLLFIYIVTLILMGFYWKNAGFSFSRQDALLGSGIFALILYSFISDLRAYWAYKFVIKNVDMIVFEGKSLEIARSAVFNPLAVVAFAMLIFGGIITVLLLATSPGMVLLILTFVAPLLIWGMYAALRNIYIKQLGISTLDKIKYKRLSHYVVIAMVMCTVMNILTISPLRTSEQFDLYGRYFTAETIITMFVLCVAVLAINLLFLRFTKRYIFLGHLFLKEVDLFFSPAIPWRSLSEKPFWLRLLMLSGIELVWCAVVGLAISLLGWKVWFEVYFLLSYLPCLAYYTLHAWWKWHNDFMMSSDMYLRWAEIDKQSALW
ncbi:hypothetical protein [Enterobacter mori]|uniref:hypothetical protein n=1 Tax=Enterobacter mori TaxID=539813 RepID=UPI003754FB2E